MNDLLKRSVTGAVFVMVLMAGILIHPVLFGLSFGLLTFYSLQEFYNLIETAGFHPHKWVGKIAGIAVFLTGFVIAFFNFPLHLFLLVFLFFILIFVFELFRKDSDTLQNNAVTLLGIMYISIPFSLVNFIVFSGEENQRFYP